MALSSTSVQALANYAFKLFFLMPFLVLLMLWDGRFSPIAPQESQVEGVVVSRKAQRFNHTQLILAQLGFYVVQRVPPNLKEWSNQMAFVNAMEEFVVESSAATPKRWRFFFEDDVALNPTITSERAKAVIAKGLEIADEDGFVYLGICDPNCEDSRVLDEHVEAARCYGTCAHAFGFQAATAAKFLQHMSGLQQSSTQLHFYMGQYMAEFGRQVKRAWVLASNLKSPVDGSHFGLLYKDILRSPIQDSYN